MTLFHPTVASLLLAAGLGLSTAYAQVQKVAYTTDDDDPFGSRNTDAGISVNHQGVVTTANMRVSLFSRSGTLRDTRQVGGTNPNPWPFSRVDTSTTLGPSRFFDPQTVYHPQSGRLWMVYSEENATAGSGQNNISPLHIAVSKDMVSSNVLDTFDEEDWWYYTGTSGSRTFFNLQGGLTKYRNEEGLHEPFGDDPFVGLVDKPHVAVDERAAYVSINGSEIITGGGSFNAIAIIPTAHGSGGSLSILDGDKPAPNDIVFLRNTDLRPARDDHDRHYTVQEPFEQVENAQFFISLVAAGVDGDPTDSIRLGGLWFNELPPPAESQWEYSQRVETTTSTVPEDLELDANFWFRGGAVPGGGRYQPVTPDAGFRPNVDLAAAFFSGGVLVKDNTGAWRIFAVHHVRPVNMPGVAQNQWVVQWYVIDPKLDTFRSVNPLTGSTPSIAWKPEVVAAGRLDTAGDRYHGVIGVTQQGVAYIEYTYSSATVWPEVRRATLNSDYDGIVPNSEMTVRTGPSYAYTGAVNGWADFADMQADPVTGCAFWSTHTLVHPPADTTYPNDERDVWLFQTLHNCNNSNLNFDEGTDLYDMAMFNSLYSAGARRVDMNVDGQTDSTDAALYDAAYEAATAP